MQVKSSGLFFLSCLFFFCAFSCSTSFVSCKNSVVFFVCCCSSQFWLCLFVRFEAFPAPISLPCLSLLLESFIPWTSPFPAVFFLPILFFLTATKDVCCYCSFVVVFLDMFLGRTVRFFFCFLLCLFCPISSKIYSFDIVYFCCVNNIVFVVFWGLLMLLLFPLGTPPWPYVSNNAPPAFSYAPCHPLFVSLCSITLLNTLLTHLRACAPSSRVHIWLCLCWCLCVFLRGCWPHCVPVPLWLWLRLLVGLCLFIFIISSLSIISTYLS